MDNVQQRYILYHDDTEVLRGTEYDLMAYIHGTHSYSYHHALKYEGYSIGIEEQQMTCGHCGEDLDTAEECKCPGSVYCTCEFMHHHRGCCEDFEDLISRFVWVHPSKDEWDATIEIEQPVLDAHDEYQKEVDIST